MKLGFRTMKVAPTGWAAIVVAGAVLGYGLSKLLHVALGAGAVLGIVVLYAVLKLLDRRAGRRALVVVRLDRNRNELTRIAEQLRAQGLQVSISDNPRGITCRGRNHARVVAALTTAARR